MRWQVTDHDDDGVEMLHDLRIDHEQERNVGQCPCRDDRDFGRRLSAAKRNQGEKKKMTTVTDRRIKKGPIHPSNPEPSNPHPSNLSYDRLKHDDDGLFGQQAAFCRQRRKLESSNAWKESKKRMK
jgi:hypothetical protein